MNFYFQRRKFLYFWRYKCCSAFRKINEVTAGLEARCGSKLKIPHSSLKNLGDGQTESNLKDTGMAGLASVRAIARRRPIWRIRAWRAWRLPGRWLDGARRSTVARWTRRRAASTYAPIPDLTWLLESTTTTEVGTFIWPNCYRRNVIYEQSMAIKRLDHPKTSPQWSPVSPSIRRYYWQLIQSGGWVGETAEWRDPPRA